jgi:uncharacterized membrane protein
MKNRTVGFLMLGVAALIGYIIFSFNKALTDIVNMACTHGPSCPMWGVINFQTNMSTVIMIVVAMIGLYLIFFSKEEGTEETKVIKQKKDMKKDYRKILPTLSHDERIVFEEIIKSDGAIFQSELVERTKLTKVKITRIIDKLEGKGLVERRRRGMTNVVIMKYQDNH